MFCNKCGNRLENNPSFCNRCGNKIVIKKNSNKLFSKLFLKLKNDKLLQVVFIVGLAVICIFSGGVMFFTSDEYFFSSNDYRNDLDKVVEIEESELGPYETSVDTENIYYDKDFDSYDDVISYVVEDSLNQKDNCSKEIIAIENELINKYNIEAVNLCELDLEFAKNVVSVFDYVYVNYPTSRDELTNFTLVNAPMSQGYVAAFMPIYPFLKPNDVDLPWGIKTQILLNSTYYLNLERLDASVIDGSASGHFPPNANTYSPIAHEFGHYLSYLALLNYNEIDSITYTDDNNLDDLLEALDQFGDGSFSLMMIEEAYNNYVRDTNSTLTLDEWRATISSYALAKDNYGEYIYDETIAEAFHDLYLNGDNAEDASKYVDAVLRKYIDGTV